MSDLKVICGDFCEVDDNGNFKNTLATIFPDFALMVVGRGCIHADQICTAADYLKQSSPGKSESEILKALCADVVSLNFIKDKITIRMELPKIELALAADAMLQQFLPKNRIQFTGLHLAEVRNALRLRGEIWRFAPTPVEETDFSNLIRHCRVDIGTGVQYLYNKHTGEHVLTYDEFMKIRPLIRADVQEAISRLKEIIQLNNLINNQGYPELVFLLPSDRKLECGLLDKIISLADSNGNQDNIDEIERLFDRFSESFFREAGPELSIDDAKCSQWRAIALCRLYNIDEKTTAEWALGLGMEFYLNIKWMPGARIIDDNLVYEPDVNPRVKSLIKYYRQIRDDFISINVGYIVCPLTDRDSTGEEREVYIVSLGLADGNREIRHVRMSKWDVKHRLKKGLSVEQAIGETKKYRDYIIDRLTAARALELSIPVFKEINIEDEYGHATIPVYYFERQYIPGIMTSRIPNEFYSRKEFLPRLSRLLGKAAAASLVLGRRDPRSFELFFDDGDELIQLNEAGLPESMMMIETTGSFADWNTPLIQMLPHCLEHLNSHFQKARQQGVEAEQILKSVDNFADGLITEIQRMQRLLNEPISIVSSLFSDRTHEPQGIRIRWEGILNRIKTTDTAQLKKLISESSYL